jgi:hypothetical protein
MFEPGGHVSRQIPQTKQFAENSILGRTGHAPAERPEKNLKNLSGTTESHALTQRLIKHFSASFKVRGCYHDACDSIT